MSVGKCCMVVQESYDLTVGTSERGSVVSGPELLHFPSFQRLLIAFGGPQGLEECIKHDPLMHEMHLKPQPEKLFMLYCNTCPLQGSRTIRTEEAILISLSYFQSAIRRHGIGAQSVNVT